MGSCCSRVVSDYQVSDHRLLSTLLTHIPALRNLDIHDIELDVGTDMDALYQKLLTNQTTFMAQSSKLSESKIYLYMGLMGLYYGPHSHQVQVLERQFLAQSNVDVSWLKAGLKGLYHSLMTPVEYTTTFNEQDELKIPNDVTILLLADFATGLDRSTAVLREAQRITEGHVHLVMHGGDTYYSGSVEEQKTNLLDPIRQHFPHSTIRALRGNHDVYSGPVGFNYVKAQVGQQATYCSVNNDFLLIQCMDTTLNDVNPMHEGINMTYLHDDEVAWHLKMVKAAKADGKKVILFSHHEPITYNDSVGKHHDMPIAANHKLFLQMKEAYAATDAYFFGHQHHFMLYEDYKFRDGTILKKPRLIGHGGCPNTSLNLDEMYHPGDYDYAQYDRPSLLPGDFWHLGHNGSVIDAGFALLTCRNGITQVDYYHVPSKKVGTFDPAVCVYSEKI